MQIREQSKEKISLGNLKKQIDDKIEYISWMVSQRINCYDENGQYIQAGVQTNQQQYKPYKSISYKSDDKAINTDFITCSTVEASINNSYFYSPKLIGSVTSNLQTSVQSNQRVQHESAKKQFLTQRLYFQEQNLKIEQSQQNNSKNQGNEIFNQFISVASTQPERRKIYRQQKENNGNISKNSSRKNGNYSKDRSRDFGKPPKQLLERNKERIKYIKHNIQHRKSCQYDFQDQKQQCLSRPSFQTVKNISQDTRARSIKSASLILNFSSSRKKITNYKSTQQRQSDKPEKPEKIIISPQIKQKMKQLILISKQSSRRQQLNNVVRANLLKRLDEKFKVLQY